MLSTEQDERQAHLDRLRQAAPPDLEKVGPPSWVDRQQALDGIFPKGSRGYWKNVSFERLIAFVRKAHALMKPFAEQGEYVNFIAAAELDRAAETTRRAYGDEKYQRLVALKDRYDPHNLFRLNHNVAPSTS